MTAGDYNVRGYGHDDQDYPSYPGQPGGGHEGYDARPWPEQRPAVEQEWHAGATWRDQPGWHDGETWHGQPGYQGEPGYQGQPGWQDDATWHGQPGYQGQPGYHGQPGWQGYGTDPYSGYSEPAPPDPYTSAPHTSGRNTEHGLESDAERAAYWADHTGGWRQPAASEPDHDESAVGSHEGRKRRGLPLWQEVPLLLVIAFCVAILVRSFLLQAFYIPSGSMENTLLAGDRVLVNKVVYNAREPARGEVVVFRGTEQWTPQLASDGDIGVFAQVARTLGDLVGISRPEEKEFIKRIIGLPGDRISCCDVDGRVFVNGKALDEDYLTHDAPLTDAPEGPHDCRTRRFDEVMVEPGHMFVVGDHRAVSQDSRCQGQVPVENIIGRAFVIVWPSGRWAGLSAPDTFEVVPQAAPSAAEVLVHDPVPLEPMVLLPMLLSAAGTFRPQRRVPGISGADEVVGFQRD